MPRILGHYVPLRFLRSESGLIFLLETTGIPTQTLLRGAALCLYKTGVIFYEV
jgi:hypothetical protein